MKKIFAILSLFLAIFVTGCASSGQPQPDAIENNKDTSSVSNPADTAPADVSAQTSPEMSDSGKVKEFTMTADDFKFMPSDINVNKGDKVRIKITAIDTEHGFAINEYGINENLPVGKEVTIEFVADKAGTFTYKCSVPCGPGHKEMTGTLIVN